MSRATSAETIAFRNASAGVSYVGSRVCAGCHIDIYRTYVKTDMGRSLTLPTECEPLMHLDGPVTVHDKTINRYFQVSREPEGFYQSEYELGADGKELFRNKRRLEYAIGSGQNGVAFITRRDNFLYEAPLTFYSRKNAWEPSPGFAGTDFGFNRPILPACLACHSGRSQPVAPGVGAYAAVPLKELAIGCENCHGPGQLHVSERVQKVPVTGSTDTSIVNPSRLTPWLADNICMSCHQGRALRVLQPGRDYWDFRPGTPLNDTVALLAVPPQPGQTNDAITPLLEHYTLMTMSKCYRRTKGRLSCLTCHNPHQQPALDAAAYYRSKCLSCHAEVSCRLSPADQRRRDATDNCSQCHMPKQPLNGIAHSVLTNHRIVRTMDEPFPWDFFAANNPSANNLLHLDSPPGTREDLAPLVVFRAFRELAGNDNRYLNAYRESLDQVAHTNPDDAEVLSGLGWLTLGSASAENAKVIELLSRAVERGSTRSSDYDALASLLAKNGRGQDAITTLGKGIQIFPYEKQLANHLTLLYISKQEYAQAMAVMRRNVTLFPEDDTMRKMLDMAQQAGSSADGYRQ